jgi:hypothetical protein
MTKAEISILLGVGQQYLNPQYDEKAPGGVEAQIAQEEKVIGQLVAALAKKDQDVLPLWKIIKKKRRGK